MIIWLPVYTDDWPGEGTQNYVKVIVILCVSLKEKISSDIILLKA